MQRRDFLSAGFAAFCAGLCADQRLNAQEHAVQEGPAGSLMEKIREAHALLAKKSLGYPRRAVLAKTEPRKVLLAVLDAQTRSMQTLPIRYLRTTKPDGTPIYSVTPQAAGWDISGLSGTGMACMFRVDAPNGKIVLAALFPYTGAGGVEEVVYTAPSPGVHIPEMIEEGLGYIDSVINTAITQLRAANIAWKFLVQGRPLIDADTPELGDAFLSALIKTIAAIEHIDHAEFSDDDPAYLVEKVLVTLGANREQAFNWSGSSANAFGLAQFIRSTYAATRSGYPQAGLAPNFIHGMRDHVNAVKAMACLIDRELATLCEKPPVQRYVGQDAKKEENELAYESGFSHAQALRLWLLACAAYNGGPGRIPGLVELHGWQWYKTMSGANASRIASLRAQESFLRSKLRRKKLSVPERRKTASALAQTEKRLRELRRAALPAETRVYLEKALAAHLFFAS